MLKEFLNPRRSGHTHRDAYWQVVRLCIGYVRLNHVGLDIQFCRGEPPVPEVPRRCEEVQGAGAFAQWHLPPWKVMTVACTVVKREFHNWCTAQPVEESLHENLTQVRALSTDDCASGTSDSDGTPPMVYSDNGTAQASQISASSLDEGNANVDDSDNAVRDARAEFLWI